jgi:hypothetical protein
MSKALALLALLCITGCYATDYYLSVYTSATTLDQDTFLFKETVSSTCGAMTADGATYAKVGTGTNSGQKIEFFAASACSTATSTIDDITIDGDGVVNGDYYYALTTAAVTLTDPTFYVATYSATGCSDDDFVGEDEVTDTCAAQTTDSTAYAELVYTVDAYALTIGCADSGCSTTCDGSALAPVVNDDTDCVAGTDAWYKVSTSTLDPDAASVLSFAAVALCALFALLF